MKKIILIAFLISSFNSFSTSLKFLNLKLIKNEKQIELISKNGLKIAEDIDELQKQIADVISRTSNKTILQNEISITSIIWNYSSNQDIAEINFSYNGVKTNIMFSGSSEYQKLEKPKYRY